MTVSSQRAIIVKYPPERNIIWKNMIATNHIQWGGPPQGPRLLVSSSSVES